MLALTAMSVLMGMEKQIIFIAPLLKSTYFSNNNYHTNYIQDKVDEN